MSDPADEQPDASARRERATGPSVTQHGETCAKPREEDEHQGNSQANHPVDAPTRGPEGRLCGEQLQNSIQAGSRRLREAELPAAAQEMRNLAAAAVPHGRSGLAIRRSSGHLRRSIRAVRCVGLRWASRRTRRAACRRRRTQGSAGLVTTPPHRGHRGALLCTSPPSGGRAPGGRGRGPSLPVSARLTISPAPWPSSPSPSSSSPPSAPRSARCWAPSRAQRNRPRRTRREGGARAERRRQEATSGTSIVGNVMQTSADAIYCARHVGLKAGLPIETPALTVNRLCGSGFQAIVNGRRADAPRRDAGRAGRRHREHDAGAVHPARRARAAGRSARRPRSRTRSGAPSPTATPIRPWP